MLTKHISVVVDTQKATAICAECHKPVQPTDLVPTDKGLVCIGCYNQNQGA